MSSLAARSNYDGIDCDRFEGLRVRLCGENPTVFLAEYRHVTNLNH